MNDQLSTDLRSLRIERGSPPVATRHGWRWIAPSVAVVALALVSVAWVAPYVNARLSTPEMETGDIVLVSPESSSVVLTATGYIVPQTVAKLASRIPGRIATVNVAEGQDVKEGEVLFVLDDRVNKNAVSSAQARANAASARAAVSRAALDDITHQYEREKKLASTGAIGQSAAEDLRMRVRVAEAQLRSVEADAVAMQADVRGLQSDLHDMRIVAPIAGRILSKTAAVGDVVVVGTTLTELASFDTLMLEADVSEAKLALVKPGAPCEIVLDAYPSKRFRGEMVSVSPRVNRAKATANVKVKFVDGAEGALPDMGARVSFLGQALPLTQLDAPAKLIIPASAVVERNGRTVAFAIENGRAKMLGLQLGTPIGAGFEMKEGPPVGTRVIKSPPSDLREGQAVKERASR